MKKILSLVLALVMVLTVVSALAAGSKTSNDINNAGTTNNGGATEEAAAISLEIIEDTEESAAVIAQLKEAFDKGDVLAALPDAIKAKLPEGFDKINEIVTAHFVGDTTKASGTYDVKITFATEYEDGTVYVAFGKLDGSGYDVVEGKAAEGAVTATFTADQVKAFGNDPFILMAISDK